jgi:N-acetylglucosaminyldiphosphoundecaprenol N-acetyl-beta-D-mannosaminyltransferase
VVSLGARKGQAWIERNRMRLHAPLISHLGAVVNFVAGSVTRAPRWMQQAGLEWLWRIKEEPTLWRRYAGDAVAFARLLLTQSLPLALYLHRLRPTPAQLAAARLRMRHENGELVIDLRGAWAAGNSRPLRTALTTAAVSGANIQIDWCVQPAPAGVGEVFQYCGARYVLDVSSAAEQG